MTAIPTPSRPRRPPPEAIVTHANRPSQAALIRAIDMLCAFAEEREERRRQAEAEEMPSE